MIEPDKTTAVTVQQSQAFSLSPRNFDEAWRMADILAKSELVPKDFRGKPENCLVAIQWGNEIGLGALQAIQNIAVINGRPALWGDAVIALVRASPMCEWVIESDDGKAATCRVKRRGEPEQQRTFSMDDARAAGLIGKQGPWTQYPKRMRQMRARGFALRDVFPDVLRGLPVAEEIMDPPAERYMGPVEIVQPVAPTHPAWPDDAFVARMPKWKEAIAAGKTAEEVIAFARSKGTLTEDQEAQIRALKPAEPEPPEVDPFVAGYEAAEGGGA